MAVRKKMLLCHTCGCRTPHAYVGKESHYKGIGPARAMIALATLGMSETTWAEKFWQCEKCGVIRNDG